MRKDGFYLVRFNDDWTVGEWRNTFTVPGTIPTPYWSGEIQEHWRVIGDDSLYQDHELQEINEVELNELAKQKWAQGAEQMRCVIGCSLRVKDKFKDHLQRISKLPIPEYNSQ